MRAPRWTVRAVLAAVGVAACAAPARRLTTRVVDDRIVVPKRMASMGLDGHYLYYKPTDARGGGLTGGFRFGITDRLEWDGVLSLRYAILDDRPVDGRAPMPMSLSVQAGTYGIGYSSMEGMFLLPVVAIDALKHVGDRWALSLRASWNAQYVVAPVAFTPAYSETLHYWSRRFSVVGIHADAVRQLDDHVAVGFGAGVDQFNDCVSPTCGWVSQDAGASVRVIVRPWRWVTISGGSSAGIRHRPDAVLPTRYPNGDPITIQPLTVEWMSLNTAIAFYW
jgi:hypothetical protein